MIHILIDYHSHWFFVLPYTGARNEPDFFVRPDTTRLPSLVIDSGWSESRTMSLNDMNLWLVGGAGAVKCRAHFAMDKDWEDKLCQGRCWAIFHGPEWYTYLPARRGTVHDRFCPRVWDLMLTFYRKYFPGQHIVHRNASRSHAKCYLVTTFSVTGILMTSLPWVLRISGTSRRIPCP